MLALFLWLMASPALAAAPAAPAPGAQPLATPNLYAAMPGCPSIQRQVAGEDKEYRGTRLDQQPPGKLLLAVDREVEGCRVVTFAAQERQRAWIVR